MPRSEPLRTTNSSLYDELYRAKNKAENIDTEDITPGSLAAIWWQCKLYENHVWKSVVSNRRKVLIA